MVFLGRLAPCRIFLGKFSNPPSKYIWKLNFHSGKTTSSISDPQRNQRKLQLNDGNFIPCFGLGVWQLKAGTETENAVKWALKYGYRQIDTASRYKNEESVGKGIRASGVAREEIFVSTKLYDDQHGYKETLTSFDESLARLGLDYVDLYLIHSPMNGQIVSTWKAMVELQQKQLVGSIGVSNFGVHHLVELLKASDIPPAVNQIEVHPFLQERELVKFCLEHNITVQAYSPLANGRKFDDKVLVNLSKKYGCHPALVLIQWFLHKGYVCIPRSGNETRIQENITAFDLVLEPDDIQLLDSLDEGYRTCHDKIKLPWTD